MGKSALRDRPRIYVACLAAYNNGHLHGVWIDAYQSVEAISGEVRAMLGRSPVADAQEYAIHDYEGFEGAKIEEYAHLGTVAALAAFVSRHGALGGALLDHFGGDLEEAGEALDDGYFGCFASLAAYVQDLMEEGFKIPELLRNYIDWEAMARDAELNGDFFTIETAHEEVHVFSAR
jgi:antirestriction protein